MQPSHEDAEEQAFSLLQRAQAAYQDQRYSEAEADFSEAMEIYTKVGNDRGTAAALTNLGAVYADTKQYPKAIEILERAIELHRKTHEERGLAGFPTIIEARSFALAAVRLGRVHPPR